MRETFRLLNAFLTGVFMAGILIVSMLFWHSMAHADSDSDSDDVGIMDTDVDIGISDRDFIVGQGSFGVDINQCMASTAWNFVIFGKQGLKENATCIADGLDARGNHAAAARVRCKHVDTVMDSFDSFELCVAAVTMTPLTTEPIAPDSAIDVEEEKRHDEFRKLRDELNAVVAENSRKLEAASRQARQQRKRNQEDREYAQQLIEEIRQIEEPPNDE